MSNELLVVCEGCNAEPGEPCRWGCLSNERTIRREAIASRENVSSMLRDIQDLALQIRTDIAISERPEVLLQETHRIQNLLGMINTQIRGYGRHWL